MTAEVPRNHETLVLDEAYKVAIEAAVAASEHVLKYWQNPRNTHFDGDRFMQIFDKTQGIGNYATIADMESEDIIVGKIQGNKYLQGHRILTEESEQAMSQSEYTWVIDPIDGTLNFRNGRPDFGISIGLLKGQEANLGIIAMPALGELVIARKGKGAQILSFDGKVIADLEDITYIQPLNKALIAYDTGYENRREQISKTVVKIADQVGYPVSLASSSATNYGIALGQLGAYFHETPTKYDIGAAAAILPEIGGVVTNMEGKPIDWRAKQVSYLGARTPLIHQQLLEILHK